MTGNIERIAHHEAGHAVIQAMIGQGRFVVNEVSIKEGAACAGEQCRAQGHALLAEETDLNIYEFGLATMAGIAAENRWFEDHPPTEEYMKWGAVSDIEEWESTCRRLYPDEAKARLVGLNVMRKLQEIFDDPAVWRVLQELAAALIERETVAGEELNKILAGLPKGNIS
jgi:hypothetical protein